MSAFADLFRLFPGKVHELCLEEAFVERRPLYYFEGDLTLMEQRPECHVCGRVAMFHWRDDRWLESCEPAIPDLTQDACEDPQCVELLAYFTARGRAGSQRRRAFKEKFGCYWCGPMDGEQRATRMALVMLQMTATEKLHADAADSRRAA